VHVPVPQRTPVALAVVPSGGVPSGGGAPASHVAHGMRLSSIVVKQAAPAAAMTNANAPDLAGGTLRLYVEPPVLGSARIRVR
jgi:hypothetical protein